MPERVFTIQPRFKIGDTPNSWAIVDGIFKFGEDIPPYGSAYRDVYLSVAWYGEPLTAGVFSTWVEKAQTVNWKITGGKNNVNHYATMLHNADNGAGWSYHEGVCGLDYLTTDKGSIEELGRSSLDDDIIQQLQEFLPDRINTIDLMKLERLLDSATLSKVVGLQHIDSVRMIKYGYPGMRWRYFPENSKPSFIPDDNIIQIQPMPSGRDRYRGFGHCALTRILDAKKLMLGYLNYYRQEIGDLPPELVVIINGLSSTDVEDSLRKYKEDKTRRGHSEYGKIWWLGSDDPMTPVQFQTHGLTVPSKAFDYRWMVEWWVKTLALNVGEDVGEFWLLQRGESKTVQSIQSMKSKGKGVARYLQEKERKYNTKIMPFGVRFEYDNPDDDADRQRNDILAVKISNLAKMASLGVDRQDPVYAVEDIKNFAKQWEIIPHDTGDTEVPQVIGAMLKEIAFDDTWTVTRDWHEYKLEPLLSGNEQEQAKFVYDVLKEAYSQNGYQHQLLEEVVM